MNKNGIGIEKIALPILLRGGVGVLPTDTLYGLVGSAMKKDAVERIYKLRKRDFEKPMIILVSSVNDLKKFGIKVGLRQKRILSKFWPGKISFILDCPSKKFIHLHRGGKTLAFRIPKDNVLIDVLKKSGPLVAPSANISGKKPAETLVEARKYFGKRIDFYVDEGRLKSKPSTLVRLGKEGSLTVLREGEVKI